jgi:hypothetical protein
MAVSACPSRGRCGTILCRELPGLRRP